MRLATSALPLVAAVLCLAAQANAQVATASPTPAPDASATEPTLLQEVVVTATRTDEPAGRVGSAFTKLDGAELERAQIPEVSRAVNLSPGVVAKEAGAQGALTEISIRGNSPSHTLVLVDGVRTNTGLFDTASPLLSYASSYNLEDIEIVRGPYSPLFGSEAIGGVVSLQTRRGSGTPKGSVFFEGGSFNTFREGILSDGSLGALDYSFHYAHEDTSNVRRNNDLRDDSGSLRLDWTACDKLTLGIAVRTQVARFQDPNTTLVNDPNAHVGDEGTSVSAYAELKATEAWTQRLTLGFFKDRYTFIDPVNPGAVFPNNSQDVSESENLSADWQNTFQITERNRLVAGATLLYQTGHDEYGYHDPYTDDQFAVRQSATTVGVYAEDQWEVIDNLVLTGGIRYDDHDNAGDAFTYRTSVAYLIEPTHTKLRASFGTAFKAPNLFQLAANEKFANGLSLNPEKSRSWDLGVDQYLLGDRAVLGLTFFRNDVRDLIAFVPHPYVYGEPYAYHYINRDSAQSHGIEASATAKFNDHWQARLAYTWTESTEATDEGPIRAPYRPRHVVSAETNYTFDLPVGKLTVGGGVYFVAQREGIGFDPVTYASKQVNVEDYTIVRVYGRYDINEHFSIFARMENALNEHYVTTINYPSLGRAGYGGVEIRF